MDESEQNEGELQVVCADAAGTFDSIEEVSYALAEAVEAPVTTGWILAVGMLGQLPASQIWLRRAAVSLSILVNESFSEAIPIRSEHRMLEWLLEEYLPLDCRWIGARDMLENATLGIHQCSHLGVE